MVLHDNPAATVLELISDPGELSNAAMSKLPTSVILPGQIRYAIANNTREGGKNDADTSGHFLSLVGENDTSLLADNNKASADMLVNSHQVGDAGSFERLIGLARLQLAKPHATVIVAASNDAAASRLVTADKGFQVVSRIAIGKSLALYSNNELQMETVTNGVSKHEAVVLKPSTADSATQDSHPCWRTLSRAKATRSPRNLGGLASIPMTRRARCMYLCYNLSSHYWIISLSETSTTFAQSC